MAKRSPRGLPPGAGGLDDQADAARPPRCAITFDCPRQHHFTVVLTHPTELPMLWACPRCGTDGFRSGVQSPLVEQQRRTRTHWEILRERRSLPELEALLADRLQLLHDGHIGPAAAI